MRDDIVANENHLCVDFTFYQSGNRTKAWCKEWHPVPKDDYVWLLICNISSGAVPRDWINGIYQ
jgi:hypothetical protein